MAWGEGERMGRIWPIRFPRVLLTMGMSPPPGSIHCYHKGKYRNTIGVCSRVRASTLWRPLLMRCYHSCKSDGEDGIRESLPLWVVFSGNLAMREAPFKVKLQSWVFLKISREILLGHTTRSYVLSPLAELRQLFWIPVFLWQILVLKGLKRKLHF